LLIGDTSNQNITEEGSIFQSRSAYQRIYPAIAKAIDSKENVTIKYTDYDTVSIIRDAI
tara:strand:+ start:200 stop:376 length:177 start_codon:yes stop_codon:yes gene_type:complete